MKEAQESSFKNISEDATLHVDASLVGTYRSAEYWPEWFSNIVALEDETGLKDINVNAPETYRVYTVDGRELSAMQKGINILRSKNGRIVKVVK